ncbi:MAG: choice-of-anchor Q domain-containing protein [Verrucomicrobiota bacterium]
MIATRPLIPALRLTLSLTLTAAAGLLSPGTAPALTGSESNYGYSFTDSTESGGPTYQWINITATGQAVVTDGDDTSTFDPIVGNNGPVELGFPFTFWGTTHSSLTAAANGFLSTVDDKGDDATHDCPLPATPSEGGGARFYLLHDDLTLVGAGDLYYQYFHKSPHPHAECGVSIFSWDQVVEKSSGNKIDIQALLFDNGDIIYQYGINTGTNSSNGYTIGIQNAAATFHLTYSCSNSGANVPVNLAVLFTPPSITVTTDADELDSPAGANISLREALREIPPGGQIFFDASLSGDELDLSSGHADIALEIDAPVCIDASSLAEPFTINADRADTVIEIDGAAVTLNHLVIREGASFDASPQGAGIDLTANSALKACHTDFLSNGPAPGETLSEGAISATTSQVALLHCRLRSNTANVGGAIYSRGANNGPLHIFHSEFACNRAIKDLSSSLGDAGAIHYTGTKEFVIENSSVFDNEAERNYGAIQVAAAASVSITQSTLSHNRSAVAGGALTLSSAPYAATISHCTFANNEIGNNAGGAAIGAGAPSAGFTITLHHNVFANNQGGDGSIDNISGLAATITSNGYNLSDITESVLNQGSDINNTDPKLGPLGPYGGDFTMTHLPLADSPLIDAGQPAITNPPATDQRKLPRIANGDNSGGSVIDIGAVEAGPFFLVTTATDENNSPVGANVSLREAVRDASSGQHIRFDPSLSGANFDLSGTGLGDLVNSNGATSIHIDASNLAERPVLDGDLADNLFDMSNGETLSLHHLILIDGVADSGGAVLSTGPVTTNDCRFSGNRTNGPTGGGAIRASGSHHAFHCSEFDNNESRGSSSQGSAIRVQSPAYMRLSDCWVHDNKHALNAFSTGRDVITVSGSLIVNRSTFSNNIRGRGNVLNRSGDGCLVVRSSTFSGNKSRNGGAALGTSGIPFPSEVAHCTFIANTSEGGVINDSTAIHTSSGTYPMTLQFNVFAKNFKQTSGTDPVNDPLRDNPLLYNSQGYNLADISPAALDHPSDLNVLSSAFDGADLRFGPLTWNGGKVPTHHPLANSPAIDGAGVNPASFTLAPNTDARGVERSQDGDLNTINAIDCGAVEAVKPILVDTDDDENNGVGSGAGTSLREAIASTGDFGRILFAPGLAGDIIDLDTAGGGQDITLFVTRDLIIDATNLFGATNLDEGGITIAGPSSTRIMSNNVAGNTLALHGVSFTDGKGSGGGALSATGSCLTITHAALYENNTTTGGGALLLNNANVLLENVTLVQNSALGGGANGGAIQATNGSDLTIRHCTIIENEATSQGAGLSIFDSDTTVRFYATALADNALTNTNLANLFLFSSPTIESLGYNISEEPATIFNDPTDIPLTNPNLYSLPPSPLFPGGLAITCPPMPGSLAVNNGPPPNEFDYPCTDARGFPRSACGNIDIGAYELGAGLGNDDIDGDGMDFFWEDFYGLSATSKDANLDLDGDGMTNLQEFLYGYKPNDPGSVLRTTQLSRPQFAQFINVYWIASPGKTYDIYHSDDLNLTDPWSKIGTVTPYGPLGQFSVTGSTILNARNAFFEIRPAP